jgi:hypothetical protein
MPSMSDCKGKVKAKARCKGKAASTCASAVTSTAGASSAALTSSAAGDKKRGRPSKSSLDFALVVLEELMDCGVDDRYFGQGSLSVNIRRSLDRYLKALEKDLDDGFYLDADTKTKAIIARKQLTVAVDMSKKYTKNMSWSAEVQQLYQGSALFLSLDPVAPNPLPGWFRQLGVRFAVEADHHHTI